MLTEDAERFARTLNIILFETSAKDNLNVEEMFLCVTRLVLKSKCEMMMRQNDTDNDTVNLRKRQESRGKKKCC